ncbi:Hpt domain-containing protein [Endozoicomonas montiporae]|uniref:Hpt domain-containing protein n=1 Tax=Endozoicomonas montiporae TaxID=1027273 RepID=UPI00077726AB|nr:Hpt domain-containing protein [Endozoicomonas montiporae]
MPIIAVTAHALPDEKKLILQSGLNDYMTKPVNVRQLANMVSHWTNQPVKNSLLPRDNLPSVVQATEEISEPSPVDRELSIQLAGGNADLADEMLDMLVKGLDNDIETLQRHARHHYHKGLLERVHRLHGSCRYCGVPELEESCHQLESLLKQDEQTDNPDVEKLLNRLLAAIDNLKGWYRAHQPHEISAKETA